MLKHDEIISKQSVNREIKEDMDSETVWSSLPLDVLNMIKHKMILSGFCLNLFPEYAFPVDRSPLILYKRGIEDDVLHYYSPIYHRSFIVACPVDISNTVLCLESNGWLLLSKGELEVLLVNPLAGISHKLPNMKPPSQLGICAFSTPPSLPLPDNFIIFKIFCAYTVVMIGLFINGDWISNKFYESSYRFQLSHSTPIYRKGLFYCFSVVGNIATYNPVKDEWICHDKPGAIDRKVIGNENTCNFVEVKGELISVFQDGKRNRLTILKLNEESMEWDNCSNCFLDGNMTLFLGYPRSIVSSVWKHSISNKVVFEKVFGEEKIVHAEVREWEGRVYFVDKTSCLIHTVAQEQENENDGEKKGVCCCTFANSVEYDDYNSKEFVFSLWYEAAKSCKH